MIDKRRLTMARIATVLFAVVAALDLWRWFVRRDVGDLILAIVFTSTAIAWTGICIRWSRRT